MSEREWQPGASEQAEEREDRRAAPDAERPTERTTEGATDDARNVEGVQGGQGGTVERERPPGGA